MYLSHDDMRRLITLLRENLYLMRCANQPLREREEAMRLTKQEIERLTGYLSEHKK